MSQLVCMCTFDVDFILFPLPTKTTPTPYNHHLFYVESLMGALPLTVVVVSQAKWSTKSPTRKEYISGH